MIGVLHGFSLVLGVIGAGYLTAMFGVVKGSQRLTLNRVAFYVATPALLFVVLQDAEPSVLLSPVIVVTTIAALLVAGVFIVASRLWFRRDFATTTLGASSSGYVNANNLGLPVAVYILGDAAYVAPLILVQLLVFAPIILGILENTRDTTRTATGGALRSVLRSLGRTASNPIIIASILGFACALADISVPEMVLAPIDMIGAAAIPLVLLSFGISLYGQPTLRRGTGRVAGFTATGIKILAMPLITWALCLAFDLTAHETFVATTIAALPTAQNMYNYAATYQRAEVFIRDTVFLTTFASLPVIAAVAWLLSG